MSLKIEHLIPQGEYLPSGKKQLSPATVNACLRELEKPGIVKGITGQKRNRLYSYVAYIQIMTEGTELPQSSNSDLIYKSCLAAFFSVPDKLYH